VNREDYEVMITDLIADFTEAVCFAAERNGYKDRRKDASWVRGWHGFDLTDKLREEVEEVLQKPSISEIGDVGWVLAMMLDQLRSKRKEASP
jgi:hypothetical protein